MQCSALVRAAHQPHGPGVQRRVAVREEGVWEVEGGEGTIRGSAAKVGSGIFILLNPANQCS